MRSIHAAVFAIGLLSCGDRATPPTPTTSSGARAPSAAASSRPETSAASSAPAPSATAADARPLYFDKSIEPADLDGRSLRELSLMRNTIYARAGNSFRRPWLDAYFRAQSWYAPKDAIDASKITALDKENARKIGDYDASLTREQLEKMRDAVVARKAAGKATPDDAIELSLLSQRLGTYVGGESAGGEPSPLEDPSRLDALLRVEELSTLSRRDLRILRNTIYARRGRPFDSKVVKSYFESAPWYKPRADYHDGMLSEIDGKNIAIVRSVEDSLGGPLHENPDYGKDGWFIQA